MRTVCIVQARMGSKRLPGKVLLPLNGHTVLEEVLSRCKRIPGVNLVAVTTPDQEIWDWVAKRAICPVYLWKGDENDVLARYRSVAEETKADRIVRITADCPLISPELCGAVVSLLGGHSYASNINPRTFPQGLDCEVFRVEALTWADKWSKKEDREHVTPWMRYSDGCDRVNLTAPWPMEGRLTLDTEDDYKTICAYFGHAPYEHLRAA